MTLTQNKLVAFVPTRDAARARGFYEGTLGLRVVGDDGFALVLDSGGTMVRVTKAPPYQPLPFTILGWQVTGIEAAAAGLVERGVAFEKFAGLPQDDAGIWTAPDGSKVAWFKDPDGNLLSISEHAG